MKIALYIEDGLEQLVLTPQSDGERNILAKMRSGKTMKIDQGSFYSCQVGWTQQVVMPSVRA